MIAPDPLSAPDFPARSASDPPTSAAPISAAPSLEVSSRGAPEALAGLTSRLPSQMPVVLCIGGFDPCAGAGLLADARACAAFGAFAIAAQTALVPQNTCGVRAITVSTPEFLTFQLEALGQDIAFNAVKIGLLPDVASIEIVLSFLRGWKAQKWLPVVVDPVLAPSSGASWSDEATIAALREQLFPLCTLVTPNAPEARILTGCALDGLSEMEAAARALGARGTENVLLKGGHIESLEPQRRNDRSQGLSVDLFWDGHHAHQLRARRVEGTEVRGTGCLLASAIAAQLADGAAPLDAARKAKRWLTNHIRSARALGQGRRIAAF